MNRSFSVFIYLMDGSAPQKLLVPDRRPPISGDDEAVNQYSVDDLDLVRWFPRGPLHHLRVSRIPGTKCALENDLGILYVKQQSTLKSNRAVRAQFGERWRGNIVVVKYAARDCQRLINMCGTDASLVNAVVRR